MTLIIIFSLLLAVFASVFTLQNAVPVTVSFFEWNKEASLALVIFFSICLGALIAFSVTIPVIIKKKWILSKLRRQANSNEEQKESEPIAAVPAKEDAEQIKN